jgi:hypothetical protein
LYHSSICYLTQLNTKPKKSNKEVEINLLLRGMQARNAPADVKAEVGLYHPGFAPDCTILPARDVW